VVVVDHYDSYTWNLVHLIASVTGELPTVVEHDRVSAPELAAFTHVVLSPKGCCRGARAR
jgi:anthranilate/para-aminobenzoate synthase component II